MQKKILWLMVFFTFANNGSAAETKLCLELLKAEKSWNEILPRLVDESTELIQTNVNCETRIIKYTKRILATDKDLAGGWRERKQRQHTQLHCNKDGLASSYGWSVMDVISDKNYMYLVTLKTRPKDCP